MLDLKNHTKIIHLIVLGACHVGFAGFSYKLVKNFNS